MAVNNPSSDGRGKFGGGICASLIANISTWPRTKKLKKNIALAAILTHVSQSTQNKDFSTALFNRLQFEYFIDISKRFYKLIEANNTIWNK